MILSKVMIPLLAVTTISVSVVDAVDKSVDLMRPLPIEASGTYHAPVVAGLSYPIRWVITKRTICPGFSSRAWVGQDGFVIVEALTATNIPLSESKLYKIETKIPELAPSGNLELTIRGYYQCEGDTRQDFTLGPVILEVT